MGLGPDMGGSGLTQDDPVSKTPPVVTCNTSTLLLCVLLLCVDIVLVT